MDIFFFLKGLLIGFSIAAPVGPIGVLCIQRTIAYGRASGLCTGLGAAAADALYGAVAAFGLTFISNVLTGQQFWFRLIGGLFLLYLGVKTFRSKPAQQADVDTHKGLFADYVSTLFLTLTNPTTILSFAAVFAGLGLGSTDGNTLSAALMVAGVFAGSAAWWLMLSAGVSLFRSNISPASLAVVNKISGGVIIAFGALSFISAVWG